jgi:hypothetical protein
MVPITVNFIGHAGQVRGALRPATPVDILVAALGATLGMFDGDLFARTMRTACIFVFYLYGSKMARDLLRRSSK